MEVPHALLVRMNFLPFLDSTHVCRFIVIPTLPQRDQRLVLVSNWGNSLNYEVFTKCTKLAWYLPFDLGSLVPSYATPRCAIRWLFSIFRIFHLSWLLIDLVLRSQNQPRFSSCEMRIPLAIQNSPNTRPGSTNLATFNIIFQSLEEVKLLVFSL